MRPFVNRKCDETRCHPLVRQFRDLRREQRMAYADIAERSGVAAATMQSWRHRFNPTIDKLVAVLDVLGYDVVIKPKAEE